MTLRRQLTPAALAVVLLGAGACTADEDGNKEDPPPATAVGSACDALLGDAGMAWLKDRTGGESRPEAGDDLKKARSLFHRQVENWGPDESGARTFLRADLCRTTGGAGRFEVRYGPSYFPFDEPFDKASDVSPAQTVTEVNSDVRLVHGEDADGATRYRVYVRCKIAGTPAQQESEVPIEGLMTDTLTGDTDARVHLTHLLHSAKVVADAFECVNKPVVPGEPPASPT
ncbi:hypothetical protein [Streptomyces xantholiticus]|uniref:hypothetical protein n=1 Tax=Streptomyces xantholiticus TaxID=68285 RepID=UPI0016762375|nr:hypothetical protein [Streptomyces xantholiticus]